MTYVIKTPTHMSYIADGHTHVVPLTLDCLQTALAKGYSPTVGHLMKSGMYIADVLFDRVTDEVVIYDYNGVPLRKVKKND